MQRKLDDGGSLLLLEDWLPPTSAAELFEALSAEVAWTQKTIRVAGRPIAEPRLTAWHGDPGTAYAYSGLRLEPLPWPPHLAALRAQVEATVGHAFNAVLCNLYRDGRDSVGFHADDEPELGPAPVIASVSLGATRRFVLKHKKRKQLPPVELELASGSLLVMESGTQRHWVHALPKTRSPVGPRINLTFRRVISAP